jgi:hypothetical protein
LPIENKIARRHCSAPCFAPTSWKTLMSAGKSSHVPRQLQ